MIKSLFSKQLSKCTGADGTVDIDALSKLVIATYEDAERDRRRTDRSISLMVEELDLLNSSLEEKVRKRTAQLHESQREIEKQYSLFDAALKNMAQGLTMYDADSRLVIANQRYADMYRFPPGILKPGFLLNDLLRYRYENGQLEEDPERVAEEILSAIRQGQNRVRIQNLPDGRHILVNCRPMSDGGWVSTHEDITERREAEQRIAHMARHDSLTDLPNRHTLLDDLSMAVRQVSAGDQVAVHYLDLDRFKTINDTLGHTVGDLLLKAVAKRLGNCVKRGDVVARIGGDEFAIVQKNVRGPENAAALASRICEAINAPYDLDGHVIVTDVSVGIAVMPDDGREPGELLKHADLALHRAKAENKGSYRFFEPEMSDRITARREMELDLRAAFKSGQFEVHYQPIVRLAASKVTSCEALLRWPHPRRGMVSPSEFIPVAEEIGLIVKLGEWVLRTACAEAMAWSRGVGVSVNISPTQVADRRFLSLVKGVLDETGLPPHRLEIEITEEVLVRNPDVARSVLMGLRDIGVRIALDDFGTGYSSLIYLCQFPFDKIKIDSSFIKALPERQPAAIVAAITGLARTLDIVTTAEGVETASQLRQVQALGCNEIQGYLVSAARSGADMARLLAPPAAIAGDSRTTAA